MRCGCAPQVCPKFVVDVHCIALSWFLWSPRCSRSDPDPSCSLNHWRRRRIIRGCSQFPVWTWTPTLQQSLQHCTQRRPVFQFPCSGETWNERSVLGFIIICPLQKYRVWCWLAGGWLTSTTLTKCARNFCHPTYLGTNPGWGRRSVTSVSRNHSLRQPPEKNCTACRAPGPPWEDLGIFHLTEEYHRI